MEEIKATAAQGGEQPIGMEGGQEGGDGLLRGARQVGAGLLQAQTGFGIKGLRQNAGLGLGRFGLKVGVATQGASGKQGWATLPRIQPHTPQAFCKADRRPHLLGPGQKALAGLPRGIVPPLPREDLHRHSGLGSANHAAMRIQGGPVGQGGIVQGAVVGRKHGQEILWIKGVVLNHPGQTLAQGVPGGGVARGGDGVQALPPPLQADLPQARLADLFPHPPPVCKEGGEG